MRPVSDTSRLEVLFAEISRAVERDQLREALRLADCACRIAPEDSTCLLIYSRLLLEHGLTAEVIERLKGRQEPSLMVARGMALSLRGLTKDAAILCEMLLSKFALDAVDNLTNFAAMAFRASLTDGCKGWVGVDSGLCLVGEVKAGSPLTIYLNGRQLPLAITQHNDDVFALFTVQMPDGISGKLSVLAGGDSLFGSEISWPPEFGINGWIMAEGNAIRGRVQMDWAPALPMQLAIRQAGCEEARYSLKPSDGSGASFSFSLDVLEDDSSPVEVLAQLPDGNYLPLLGSPLHVRASMLAADEAKVKSFNVRPDIAFEKLVIDVIIPVYAGFDETFRCIGSVLETTTHSMVEVIVVNDATPDSQLRDALVLLALDGKITLLENKVNLGFPGAANKGIHLHPDRDVILLNADTELFGDWLERLKTAAYSSPEIGTVTPLGEAASIVSYPNIENRPHTRTEAEEIDKITREVNTGKTVNLPVGVGFCLYIKRACLRDVDAFDERTFGKGYGEENDLCLRASAHGWRHVAAADLYVRHKGAVSFGSRQAILRERNGHVLNARHPGYDHAISEFVASDPLLEVRRTIDMHRLIREAEKPVLLVTSGLPGGVRRHIETRRKELGSKGHTVVLLQSERVSGLPNAIRLSTTNDDLKSLVYRVPEDLQVLRVFLQSLGLQHIELHHFVGLPPAALEMVTELDRGYQVYVHDYAWICPRLTLADGSGAYCGEPAAIEDCENCIRKHGTFLEEELTVEALRQRSARIVREADAVIVPVEDVRNRLARYFPDRFAEIKDWESPAEYLPRSKDASVNRLRIAVIGAISVSKGFQVLLECAKDAAARELELDFIVIGYTCDDAALLATGQAFVTGPYAEDEVSELLAREQCHIAFFPSVVPETWCYALTHALIEGLPVVAFDLGAIAERLRGYAGATMLSLSSSATEINDLLLESARNIFISNPQKVTRMEAQIIADNVAQKDAIATSVQFVPLPQGIYIFTVKGGASSTSLPGELTLPAMQVGIAPSGVEGSVEFLARGTTMDRWLVHDRDMIIAKISGGSASLMLTSMRLSNSPVLAVDIRRIDSDSFFSDTENLSDQADTDRQERLPAQILAHIHRIGDVPFSDGWAGCVGDRLWIEAFAIGWVGALDPEAVEYCGITADGYQTPWLGNQMLCGSRGRAVPMIGCAIRLKPEAAEKYDLSYTGQFISGRVIGPLRNGDLCCSDLPQDPLWGIELHITPRNRSDYKDVSSESIHSNVA